MSVWIRIFACIKFLVQLEQRKLVGEHDTFSTCESKCHGIEQDS